eukprot:6814443-Prymnesium_polylepis.1
MRTPPLIIIALDSHGGAACLSLSGARPDALTLAAGRASCGTCAVTRLLSLGGGCDPYLSRARARFDPRAGVPSELSAHAPPVAYMRA